MNKKLSVTVLCISFFSIAACGSHETTTTQFTVKNYSDSVAKKVQDVNGELKISIDYPETGNEALLNGIREWILDHADCNPTTDINSGDSIVRNYIKTHKEEMDRFTAAFAEMGSAQGYSNDIEIKKTFEDDKWVTFNYTLYHYEGGAHGMMSASGTTFRKSDGKVFGYNMLDLTSREHIAKLIEQALAEEMGFDTVEELKSVLFLPEGAETVPLPEADPYLDKDAMVFVYQQYEIGPYAMGMPTARIPLNKLDKYLSASFKRMK